jgi:hypothetical protein
VTAAQGRKRQAIAQSLPFRKDANMQPSVLLCQTQEALQRARAAGATLDNVRTQANYAAAAWAKEGELASKREARKRLAEARNALQLALPSTEDRGMSENPDRAFALL